MERYYLYNADKYVGVLTKEGTVYDFKQERYGFLEDKMVDDIGLNVCKERLSFVIFQNLICERIFPRDRINGWDLLIGLGLNNYDEWEIFKKIRGVHQGDTFWMGESKDCGKDFWTKHPSAPYLKQTYADLRKKGLV